MTHRSRKYFGYPAKDYSKMLVRIMSNQMMLESKTHWERFIQRQIKELETAGIMFPKVPTFECCNTTLKQREMAYINGNLFLEGNLYAKYDSQEGDIVTLNYVGSNRYMQGQKIQIKLNHEQRKIQMP